MAEGKKVEVSEDSLNALIEQNRTLIQALQEGDFSPTLRTTSVKSRTVTILFINGKAVVGYANHGTDEKPTYIYEAPDPKNPKEYLLFVDVVLRGQDAPLKLNYNEFLRESERHECLVKEIKEAPWTETQGNVEKKEVPEGAYYATPTGFVVPVEIKGVIRSFVVTLPDGKDQEFHERYVNIAK